jgi:hypothetical protein
MATISIAYKKYKPLAIKMQEVYISGGMPDGIHRYKSNSTEIAKKLEKFFETYDEYTDEEIIDATKRYVASFRGNYRYAKALNNFVWKMEDVKDEEGNIHKERHSYLADFLENKDSEQDTIVNGDILAELV